VDDMKELALMLALNAEKKLTHFEKLTRWADFLEKLPPEKFNINNWVSKHENGCGTVCCAAGWLPVVFPASCGSAWVERLAFTYTGEEYKQFEFGVRIVEDFLGLHFDDFDYITSPAEYELDKPSPQIVAQRIREVVEAYKFGRPTFPYYDNEEHDDEESEEDE
jgi:hypothetical protein